MALSIRNKQVEELARLLAYERGTSLTDALLEALDARLRQLGPESRMQRDMAAMERAARRIAELPPRNDEGADDPLDYDENGLPR